MNEYQDVNMDNLRTIIDDIISNYCINKNIDENNIYPSVWTDIIYTIKCKIFRKSKILKLENAIHNDYDKSKVLQAYEIYKSISNSHCQQITIKKFIDMIDIDKQTLYNWGLSAERFDLANKIMDDQEESLEGFLLDKRYNPMKALPILNRYFSWNLPGVSREKSEVQTLQLNDTKKAFESFQIEQKETD